jgi:hypothetical protein
VLCFENMSIWVRTTATGCHTWLLLQKSADNTASTEENCSVLPWCVVLSHCVCADSQGMSLACMLCHGVL